VPENERVYQVGDIFDPTSRTWYNLTVRRAGRLATATFEFWVTVQQRLRLFARVSHFADREDDAPVLHFDGPLTMGLFTTELVRSQAGSALEAWIGTNVPAGAKGQPTYVVHDNGVPKYVFPIAQVSFANPGPPDAPMNLMIPLDRRVGRARFAGPLRVPEEVAAKPVNVTLSASNNGWRNIRPATCEVPVVPPASNR
jgi:hypothetical protein